MSKNRWPRNKLFVDVRIQGALAVRIVLYWLMCLFAIGVLLVIWRVVSMPLRPVNFYVREIWSLYGPAAVASIFVLPMVLFDMLRLTNRFAGPMFRLRRSMRELAQGRPVAPIKFRDGDFWPEFAHDFNLIATRLRESQEHDNGTAVSPSQILPSGARPRSVGPDLAPVSSGVR